MSWTRTTWIGTDALPAGMTHLTLPILRKNHLGQWMCFATSRDRASRSHLVCTEAELDDEGRLKLLGPWRIIAEPGHLGHFDENGLSLSDIRPTAEGFEGVTFGWRLREGGGWFNEIGHLTMDLSGTVLERSLAPCQSRTEIDPISMAYPTFGDEGQILYCAPTALHRDTGRPSDFRVLRLNIKSGRRAILIDPDRLNIPGVFALTRPWLHQNPLESRIYFCMRGDKYRIMSVPYEETYRLSGAGHLREEILALPDEHEAGSVCYPSIIEHHEVSVLLYNGDGYGASGFGVAVRERGELNR